MSLINKKHTALHLVNQLSFVNYSISYLLINLVNFLDKSFNINSYILTNKIEKNFVKHSKVSTIKINLFFIKQIRFFIKNQNIKYIHIHNIWNLNFLLVIFFYRKNLIYFIHPHGMLLPEALNNKNIFHFLKKILFLKLIKYFILKKNVIFFAITYKEKKSIQNFFSNKIYLLGTFYYFKKKIKQNYKLKKNFVCLSRISPHKRILDLIESFYQANLKNNHKLFIYGERESNYYFYKCLNKIKKLGLKKRVFLKKAIYSKKKTDILLSSWANVLISYSEVISLSVIESGYYYLPSLLNKNIVESSFPKKSTFVCGFSISEIANKIKEISIMPLSQRIYIGKKINVFICSNFSIRNYASKLLKVYKIYA